MYRILLISTIILHHFVVLTNIISFFLSPFLFHPLLACPIMSNILVISFSRNECPITTFENYLRAKLGMKKIGGFIGHYYVRPARSLKSFLRALACSRSDPKGKDE